MRPPVTCAVGAALLLALLVGSGCMQDASRRPPSPTPPPRVGAPTLSDPRTRFAEAVALYDRGALAPAAALFRKLLDGYPALEDYHLAYLAAIEDRGGHPREASAFDDRLLAAHPTSVWVPTSLARRARSALALGDPQAEDLAERARDAAADDRDARGTALAVLAALRAPTQPREAYELYQTVRGGGGEPARLAREACAALESAHPELLQDPALLIPEGRLLVTEGRLDLALQRLEAAATRASGDTRRDALRALAKAHQQAGHLEAALATYRTAVAGEPADGMARFDLASLLWNRDRDDEARTLFTQIVGASPRHPKYETARYALGRIAEQEGHPDQAERHFRQLAAEGGDGDLAREARWRLAWMPYRRGDLVAAGEAFTALGAGSDKDRLASWYWQGRILDRRGLTTESQALYAAIVSEAPDGYYADLAEPRLTTPAPPPPAPQPLDATPPPGLALNDYHWSRSQELRAAGMNAAAARELAALIRDLPDGGEHEPFLLQAYTDMDATTRALRLALRLGSSSELPPATLAAYAYPRAYWSHVTVTAERERLDPYVVLALMRQESLFDPEAVSSAAAYGLMQLLVDTASRVAGVPVERGQLFDPSTNIALGTRYLRQLLDRYRGNVAKALAAYNGGEEAVAKWERRAPDAASDEFVETISYRETRNYVKQVLGNYRRYRRLYGAPGEQRALEVSDAGRYETRGTSSAATSLPASPPNPPFDISTTTSPGAT